MPLPSRRVAVVVPWRTILKIVAAAVMIWLWFKLVEVVLVVLVALLLAVTLNPVVTWFDRRMPRWAATLLVGLMLVAVIGGFLWMTWASLSSQAAYVTNHFDQIQRDMWKKVPGWVQNALGGGNLEEIEKRVGNAAVSFARSAVSAVIVSVLGFILMLYFLIEGQETRDWLIALWATKGGGFYGLGYVATLITLETVSFEQDAAKAASSKPSAFWCKGAAELRIR